MKLLSYVYLISLLYIHVYVNHIIFLCVLNIYINGIMLYVSFCNIIQYYVSSFTNVDICISSSFILTYLW